MTAEPASSPSPDRAELLAEIEALRRAAADEQARLEAVTQARSATEQQLTALQQEVAALAARREAQPPAPVTAPMPPPAQAPPPAMATVTPPPPPPPRPPRVEPAAVTANAQPRVVLHHRAGSPAAAEAALAVVSSVREAGFSVDEVRTATAVPSQRVVRYFHAEDAPTAARLAGRLGRGWAIQDFRTYEPSPSPGTLEVWLPER